MKNIRCHVQLEDQNNIFAFYYNYYYNLETSGKIPKWIIKFKKKNEIET